MAAGQAEAETSLTEQHSPAAPKEAEQGRSSEGNKAQTMNLVIATQDQVKPGSQATETGSGLMWYEARHR